MVPKGIATGQSGWSLGSVGSASRFMNSAFWSRSHKFTSVFRVQSKECSTASSLADPACELRIQLTQIRWARQELSIRAGFWPCRGLTEALYSALTTSRIDAVQSAVHVTAALRKGGHSIRAWLSTCDAVRATRQIKPYQDMRADVVENCVCEAAVGAPIARCRERCVDS